MSNQLNDFKWFNENRKELFNKYGLSYLAIKNQEVIGVYDSYSAGVKNTQLSEKIGTFIVEHCTNVDADYMNYIYSMNY